MAENSAQLIDSLWQTFDTYLAGTLDMMKNQLQMRLDVGSISFINIQSIENSKKQLKNKFKEDLEAIKERLDKSSIFDTGRNQLLSLDEQISFDLIYERMLREIDEKINLILDELKSKINTEQSSVNTNQLKNNYMTDSMSDTEVYLQSKCLSKKRIKTIFNEQREFKAKAELLLDFPSPVSNIDDDETELENKKPNKINYYSDNEIEYNLDVDSYQSGDLTLVNDHNEQEEPIFEFESNIAPLNEIECIIISDDDEKKEEAVTQSPVRSEEEMPEIVQGELKKIEIRSLMREDIISFHPHECSPKCVSKWENRLSKEKEFNPLLMPLFHGWQRQICKKSNQRSSVSYVAPCGRNLRSIVEISEYLDLTDSKLTIDLFSNDHSVQINREFEANSIFLHKDDISEGRENMLISCVNCVDMSQPEEFEYTANRVPLEGVPLVTDKTEGCNCVDNCRNWKECACWQKTFNATLFTSDEQNPNVSYIERRLNDWVVTGIFECNPNCKCDCRCSNRVVQNGIAVRLQLFKTPKMGWGVRCLDDIPKGTFICTYIGEILTEKQSESRTIDTYFANLDFVNILKNECHKRHQLNNPDAVNINYEQSSQQTRQSLAKNNSVSDGEKKSAQLVGWKDCFKSNQKSPFIVDEFLQDGKLFMIDGKIKGNIGRFFNHSCWPNLFVQNVFVDTYDIRFPWIAFFTNKYVEAGTELCWDYQYELLSDETNAVECRCKSENCRGRLL